MRPAARGSPTPLLIVSGWAGGGTFLVAGGRGNAEGEARATGLPHLLRASPERSGRACTQKQPPVGLQLMGSWLSCRLKARVADATCGNGSKTPV
eukprot:3067867-Pyramimonas_sp.AAC.1